MHKLIETAKTAKNFSDIYPALKIWKISLKYLWLTFDEMAEAMRHGFEMPTHQSRFEEAVNAVAKYKAEILKAFPPVNFNKKGSTQIDFWFDYAPMQHIVDAENRLITACLLYALKPNFTAEALYAEWQHYCKAHEIIIKVGYLSNECTWASGDIETQLADELRLSKKIGALSFL
jgi:hypothetical protein